jgi:cytochrome P450
VDELLRFCEPPSRASSRFADEDTLVAGRLVAKGTAVYVFRSAANRDPARFPDGHRLDLRRPKAPGSLAFGAGPHYCLGAQLVHLIADVTLLTMLPLIDTLRPTERIGAEWDFADALWLEVVRATPSEGSAPCPKHDAGMRWRRWRPIRTSLNGCATTRSRWRPNTG